MAGSTLPTRRTWISRNLVVVCLDSIPSHRGPHALRRFHTGVTGLQIVGLNGYRPSPESSPAIGREARGPLGLIPG